MNSDKLIEQLKKESKEFGKHIDYCINGEHKVLNAILDACKKNNLTNAERDQVIKAAIDKAEEIRKSKIK